MTANEPKTKKSRGTYAVYCTNSCLCAYFTDM